ncbi:hypothetical protein ACIPT9_05195 [Pectobacterium carotovorum]|uniref:hypothetical protein n=1 Tax=Pectobacterium carotovorum TaxID=554 RepID=UPI0037FD7A4B
MSNEAPLMRINGVFFMASFQLATLRAVASDVEKRSLRFFMEAKYVLGMIWSVEAVGTAQNCL